MNQKNSKRGTFSNKMGYVLSVAGSAVGLGNIWRFPYLAAKYGGDASFASQLVAISTILSLISIPLWALIL